MALLPSAEGEVLVEQASHAVVPCSQVVRLVRVAVCSEEVVVEQILAILICERTATAQA